MTVKPAHLLELLDDERLLAVPGLRPGSVPAALWEEALLVPARDLLGRPGKGLRGRLVEAGWRLGGGVGSCPVSVPLLVEVLHAGSLIVDDIEDGSTHRRGEPAMHLRYGLPRALNLGNWMYFWPQQIIARLGLPTDVELALHHRVNDTLYRCHLGQGLDLAAHVADLARADVPSVVATMTQLKTGALTELAVTLGALVALARPARVTELARFGSDAGVALQMLDDLGNLVGHAAPEKQYEDLRLGRVTWAWAWLAERVDDATYARLARRVRGLVAEPDDAAELAAEIASHMREHGRQRAHARLAGAIEGLRGAVGAAAEPFAHELLDLEERYVAAV